MGCSSLLNVYVVQEYRLTCHSAIKMSPIRFLAVIGSVWVHNFRISFSPFSAPFNAAALYVDEAHNIFEISDVNVHKINIMGVN